MKTSGIRKHLVKSQSPVEEESDHDETKEEKDETVNMKTYKQFFRELDWDIWVMLSLPLTLDPKPEKVVSTDVSILTLIFFRLKECLMLLDTTRNGNSNQNLVHRNYYS